MIAQILASLTPEQREQMFHAFENEKTHTLILTQHRYLSVHDTDKDSDIQREGVWTYGKISK